MTVIETVQYRTPLAVAFHDLVTDAPITDGLVVSARRAGIGGRFRVGYPTPSGVHVLSGLPFLRDAELPLDGPGERAESEDTPSSQTAEVDVLVEDRLGRFLPTVLRLSAPRDRVATAADVLSACSSLVWSVPAETPISRALSKELRCMPTGFRMRSPMSSANPVPVRSPSICWTITYPPPE